MGEGCDLTCRAEMSIRSGVLGTVYAKVSVGHMYVGGGGGVGAVTSLVGL